MLGRDQNRMSFWIMTLSRSMSVVWGMKDKDKDKDKNKNKNKNKKLDVF
jgi:hypothetical protein